MSGDTYGGVAVSGQVNINQSMGSPAKETSSTPATKKRIGKRKPNYVQLHRNPLPLEVYPLPVFHPTHPLSLLQLIWTCLRQLVSPPSSHSVAYVGHFSAESRSVHITDPRHVRALWEKGFFGKGTLSRSEPTWMDREKARLAARSQNGQTAEEVTKARREERRMFKLERARLERERIDRQRLIEQGELSSDELTTHNRAGMSTEALLKPPITLDETVGEARDCKSAEDTAPSDEPSSVDLAVLEADGHDMEEPQANNQEHLQLTLEEAFFLKYALGVLEIRSSAAEKLDNNRNTLDLFRQAAKFDQHPAGMDDQFILNYVVYHHFRSLGWVVRSGVKFSVDYLLYNRGPVFSHAEFAILIMPSYSHSYWSTSEGRSKRRLQEQKDWWWLHCINRVQSQVRKTLVLCYVDIPPPRELDEADTVEELLSRYGVREFIVRRWLMNRSRD